MTHCPKLGGKSLGVEPPGIGPALIKMEKCSLKLGLGTWVGNFIQEKKVAAMANSEGKGGLPMTSVD